MDLKGFKCGYVWLDEQIDKFLHLIRREEFFCSGINVFCVQIFGNFMPWSWLITLLHYLLSRINQLINGNRKVKNKMCVFENCSVSRHVGNTGHRSDFTTTQDKLTAENSFILNTEHKVNIQPCCLNVLSGLSAHILHLTTLLWTSSATATNKPLRFKFLSHFSLYIFQILWCLILNQLPWATTALTMLSRKLSNLMEKVKIRKQNRVDSVLLGTEVYALHALHNVFTYFSSYFHTPFSEIYNIINKFIPLTTSRTENIKYSEIISQATIA